ncbi:MAG: hypothetical protein B7X28_05340 [Halothiobacillus sp. 13-55-253]|nr:MAG: hypothetical protein B7X28_05340 [Halothiobacillus sp. 13-55-253]
MHLGLSDRTVNTGNRGGVGPEVVTLAIILTAFGLLTDQMAACVVGKVGGAFCRDLLPTQGTSANRPAAL